MGSGIRQGGSARRNRCSRSVDAINACEQFGDIGAEHKPADALHTASASWLNKISSDECCIELVAGGILHAFGRETLFRRSVKIFSFCLSRARRRRILFALRHEAFESSSRELLILRSVITRGMRSG